MVNLYFRVDLTGLKKVKVISVLISIQKRFSTFGGDTKRSVPRKSRNSYFFIIDMHALYGRAVG